MTILGYGSSSHFFTDSLKYPQLEGSLTLLSDVDAGGEFTSA